MRFQRAQLSYVDGMGRQARIGIDVGTPLLYVNGNAQDSGIKFAAMGDQRCSDDEKAMLVSFAMAK